MELRQIEAFVAVVREGSFTRAAAALHLTQPAVTRQIAALEAELGVALFERLGRRSQMSAAGEAFLPHAQELLRRVQDARTALVALQRGEGGMLTLASSSTLASYVLPPVLARFRALHPGVELQLRTGLSAQVRALVQAGDAHLGLATTEGEAIPSERGPLEETALAPYETVAVLPQGHRLAAEKSLAPEALAGEPLLAMPPGTTLRGFVERAFGAAMPPVAMELDSVEAIKRMVEAGLGVSLLPRVAVAAETESGRLVALALQGQERAERRIVLLRRRGGSATPAQETLERLLTQAHSTSMESAGSESASLTSSVGSISSL